MQKQLDKLTKSSWAINKVLFENEELIVVQAQKEKNISLFICNKEKVLNIGKVFKDTKAETDGRIITVYKKDSLTSEADGSVTVKWVEKYSIDISAEFAKAFARDELGKDFDKAFMFWKKLNCLENFNADNYHEMIDGWKTLIGILSLVDGTNIINDEVQDIASALANVFSPQEDVSLWSKDDCISYISDTIEDFKLQVFSERISKDSFELIKIGIHNIVCSESGIFVFDESKLYDPKTVKAIPKDGIQMLSTAEDGIARILREKGISTIAVEMASIPESDLELNKDGAEEIHKHKLLTEGFYTASGKHYMPAFQSASSTRKATITFALVTPCNTIEECREQIQNMWLDVTGIATWEEFLDEFCDENGEVVIAKVVARVAMRGSNSFSLSKIAPEIAEIIKNFRVHYTLDKEAETIIRKKFRSIDENGFITEITEKDFKFVDGDGQGIISFEASAYIAASLRRISENDLEFFLNEWANIGKDVSKVKSGRLDRIIKRIPAVFQIRHGEKKGLLVRWNLEAIEATKNIDVIIPESVRKFIGGEWSEYPLEICNFLKKKTGWAYLNPQFVSALNWENPNALVNIQKYWEKFELESIHDIAKAQHFHNIMKSSDDEESKTKASNLVTALRTSSDLIDDFQVINWRKDQYRKFNTDMRIGRLMVPGQYTYMIFDPNYLINKWFNLSLPCLATKEFYHNGKTCKAMLARSPLISPYEAQKVQLVNKEQYKYLADTVVFNGYDGTADDMGGGDFDGDICEIILDEYNEAEDDPTSKVVSLKKMGHIIVSGIRDCDYVMKKDAGKAKKVPFTWENLIHYWATVGSTKDRTGPITNYATKALDIANHLRSCIFFAKIMNCEYIAFVHPKSFGKGLGCNVQPQIQYEYIDGKKVGVWVVRGLVEAKLTKKAKASGKYDGDFRPEDVEVEDVWFPFDFNKGRGFIGYKSFKEIEKEIEYYENINLVLRLIQGDEIDGAKTGFYPEIPKYCMVNLTANHMLDRQADLGRDQSRNSKLNAYWSLSPLGRIHEYTSGIVQKVDENFNAHGSNKIMLLETKLLTKQERDMLDMRVRKADGNECTLVEYITERKKAYNLRLYNVKAQVDEATIRDIMESEINELYANIKALNITPEVMAVACYKAAYTKDSKQGEGLSYGWLLFDELISVFSRGNKKFELFRMPSNIESACIINKVLYVNGNKYINVNAEDCENVIVQVINGRNYALIHKIATDVIAEEEEEPVVCDGKIYYINTSGFKYHITEEKFGKIDKHLTQMWEEMVAANKRVFDIVMDDTNRCCIAVNGKTISALSAVGADYRLVNKKVMVVNNLTDNNGVKIPPVVDKTKKGDYANSISNIAVIIIGKADKLI